MTNFNEHELAAISNTVASHLKDENGEPLTGFARFRVLENIMPIVALALQAGEPVLRAKVVRELRSELPSDNLEIDFALAKIEHDETRG